MKIYHEIIRATTEKGIHLINISDEIKNIVEASGVNNGFVTVNSNHTTTALTINEYESRLMDDVRIFLNQFIPPKNLYLHNDIHLRDCPHDEPENAQSHIASMMFGNTESIIVKESSMQLGQWQSIILIELDGPRERQVAVQVIGE